MDRAQQTPAAAAEERRQIVAGLLVALEARGPRALRERDVIEAAETSPRVFRAHFDDLDACFDFACEAVLDTLLTPMAASWSVPRPPAARLDAALEALLGSLAAQPHLAELCLLHSTARQPDRRTRRRAVEAIAALLRDLRPRPSRGSPPPRSPGEPASPRLTSPRSPGEMVPPPSPGELVSPPSPDEEAAAREVVDLIAARLADGGAPDLGRLRPRILTLLAPSPKR